MGMSLLATTDTQIIRVVEALYNLRPGSIYLNNFQNFVTEHSIDGFANSLAADFESSTAAELAAIVTSNLGLTGGALTAGNAYLEAQFTANSAARGKVILDAMNTLSGMESDAVYGAAATLYNADVTASLVYSQVAANTTVTTSDAATDVDAVATFTLTTGTDSLTGTASNETFSAGEGAAGVATLTAGDSIDGGAGTDTIKFIETDAITGLPTGATISNVENFTIIGGNDVTFDSSSISGLTTLQATTAGATGDQVLTAAATTDITSIVTLQADQTISLQGGKDISGTYTGATTSTITIGGTTAPAGTVTTSKTMAYVGANADVAGGTTAVTGGTTQSITQSAGVTAAQDTAALALTNNATVTQGNITATGGSATTAITVTQDATVAEDNTAGSGAVGITAGTVTIADTNAASTTAAGTLATVTLDNYGNSTIDSSALTTVNLSGVAGTLGISRGGLDATPTANTLTLNLNGVTGTNTITDSEATGDDGFTTIALAGNTTASTIDSLIAADATTLTASGDAKITLTAHTMAALTSITVTNTGGLDMDGAALAAGVTFTGGDGADAVSLGATTKAITMGEGDDIVISAGTVGTGGTVDAGAGTADKIIMTTVQAEAADNSSTFNSKFTNFEVLEVSNALAATANIDLDGINGASKVILTTGGGHASTAILTNLVSGGTVQLDANTTGVTVGVKSALTSITDSLNLAINATGVRTTTTFTAANVETIAINVADAATAGSAAVTHVISTLAANAATSITVAGNNGLTITAATGSVAVTSFDASGVVANDTTASAGVAATTDTAANLAVTYTSVNATADAAVTITGGAGDDVLTGSAAALNADTISGGAGADTIIGGTGVDTLTGGEGADTITGGLEADVINLTETTAAIDTVILTTGAAIGVDVITGFNVATAADNGDNVDIDLSDINALVGDLSLAGNFATASNVGASAAPVIAQVAVGAYDMATDATAHILNIVGDYATAGDLETALEIGGTSALTTNSTGTEFAANDAFMVLYDNGTNSFLAYVVSAAGAANDATFASSDLTVTNMVQFTGISDSATFVTNNFDIIA
jgi:S-layer protein